ncbi:MAG: MFS transporter [Ruminococcaceae bacterium]|nr:MFS transporter [Oscillospiraceae bacterium]
MNASEIVSKVKAAPDYIKSHWNTPGEGEYLTLKEMAAYTVSQAGTYIYCTASNIVTFSATLFCGAIMEIPAMDFYLINLATTIIGYVLMFTNPVGMLIYENHGRLTRGMKIFAHTTYLGQILIGIACYFIPANTFEAFMMGAPQIVGNILVTNGITGYVTWLIRRLFGAKHGRVKPMILICCIPAMLLLSGIPYLPVQDAPYVTKLVVLHFVFTLMNFFHNNFIVVNNLVAYMTPNSQERQKLYSIVPIITGFAPSVINIFFPMLIASTGGYTSLKTYRIFVPIFAFVGAVFTLAAAFCKERTIEEGIETRKKVSFFEGAKNAFKNKYLWMINVSNVVGQWQWMVGNVLQWWFIYSLREETLYGIATSIVVIGMTPGNLLCVWLTKKFEKRNVLLIARAASIVCILGMLVAINTENILIFLVCLFLRNTLQPIDTGVATGLGADAQIYHQWRFGERCDSISGVFTWLTNPLNLALGYFSPWILQLFGFTSDWDVLYDTQICADVFSIHVWFNIISLFLSMIPFFFYNLTKEKHDMCVKELQQRLEASGKENTDTQEVAQ